MIFKMFEVSKLLWSQLQLELLTEVSVLRLRLSCDNGKESWTVLVTSNFTKGPLLE